jgi:PAS domain S-box-containing protein
VKLLGQRLMLGHIRDATDQFQILETLAGKEQEFRSLAESSPYSIIRYDRDGYIRYLNAKLASDLGISLTEVIGQLPNEAWPDKRFDAIQQAAAKAVKSEVEVAIEIIGPEIFNVPSFHQIHIVPEKNAYGKVIGTVAFGIDITVQKQYTKSLLERAKLEEQLSGVAASVPGFIYSLQEDVNQKLRFSYASVGVEELFGLSPEDVCEEAETLWSRFHPEDVSRIFCNCRIPN